MFTNTTITTNTTTSYRDVFWACPNSQPFLGWETNTVTISPRWNPRMVGLDESAWWVATAFMVLFFPPPLPLRPVLPPPKPDRPSPVRSARELELLCSDVGDGAGRHEGGFNHIVRKSLNAEWSKLIVKSHQKYFGYIRCGC